ncbi:hypothetical protein KC325_g131 [Hortaea werneckii]|nr:hypothetical protein KC325_g131 [Hortaea werneckii]
MRFVVVLAVARPGKASVDKILCEWRPGPSLRLFLNYGLQVHPPIKLVRLCTRIAYPASLRLPHFCSSTVPSWQQGNAHIESPQPRDRKDDCVTI